MGRNFVHELSQSCSWRTLTAAALGGGLAFLIYGPAVAADTSSDQYGQIETVTVTAEKRAENLQSVAISAQVVSAQMLNQQNLTSLNDMVQTIPSVHISGVGGGGRANELFIRGIGSGNNQSFDQSVGMFIDDIYHGRSRTSGATFLDLERVEVLKGPQSTFFGNNAIAGSFNIVTAKPSDTFEGWARALYGEDGQYATEGAISGPITDTLSARAAVTFNGQSGWLTNVSTGGHAPEEDNIAGRLTLLFTPNQDLDATLKIEGSKKNNRGSWGVQVLDCPPPSPFVTAGFCSTRIGLGLPTGLGNNKFADSAGTGDKLDTGETVLTVNYRRWDHTFTSITGFYDYHYTGNLDADFTPLPLLNIQAPEKYHQFSQEFRVASPAGQSLEYLAGAYFQTDRLFFRQDFTYYFLSPKIASIPPFAALVPYLPLAQDDNFGQDEDSYSVFGSLTWNVTDRLKLSGGLRGSWVHKSFDWNLFYGTGTQTYGGVVALPAPVATLPAALGLGKTGTISGERDDHAWMPSAKIQYQIDPAAMVYFSYSKGFKAGGFNGTDNTGVAANLPFNPESVNAYEVGMKSEWFDDTLLLNVDAFRSDYNNLQVTSNLTSTGAIISLVTNAASALSQGIEFDGQWAVSENFRLAAVGTYLDSHYVSYPNGSLTNFQTFCRGSYVLPACTGLPNPVPSIQNLSGRPTEFAPQLSGSVSGTYSAALPGNYQLTTELIAIFASSYFLTNVDDPLVKQSSYARLDARLTLESPDRRWALDLIGKNLNNQIIETFALNVPTTVGSVYAQKEELSNISIQVRYQW
ncbi:MAG: TonB-dependent receptor [Alphaproteobacteria bacterium]|nr:TonB-dependent receptor [Alphaproteobacteria bacterium]